MSSRRVEILLEIKAERKALREEREAFQDERDDIAQAIQNIKNTEGMSASKFVLIVSELEEQLEECMRKKRTGRRSSHLVPGEERKSRSSTNKSPTM